MLLRSLLLLGLAFGFGAGSLAALAALLGGRLFSAPCLGDVWAMGNPSCAGVIGVMPHGSKRDPMEQSLDQNDVVTSSN